MENLATVAEFLKRYYKVYEKSAHTAVEMYSKDAIVAHGHMFAQGTAAIARLVTKLPIAGISARVVSLNFQTTGGGFVILAQGIAVDERLFSQTFVLGRVGQSQTGEYEVMNDMMLFAPVQQPLSAVEPGESVAGYFAQGHADTYCASREEESVSAKEIEREVSEGTWTKPEAEEKQTERDVSPRTVRPDAATVMGTNVDTAPTAMGSKLEEYVPGDVGNRVAEVCPAYAVSAEAESVAKDSVGSKKMEAEVKAGALKKREAEEKVTVEVSSNRARANTATVAESKLDITATVISFKLEECVADVAPGATETRPENAVHEEAGSGADESVRSKTIEMEIDGNICSKPQEADAALVTGTENPSEIANGRRSYGPTAVVYLRKLEFDRRMVGTLKKDLRDEFSSYGHAVKSVTVKTRMGLAFIEYASASAVRTAVDMWKRGSSQRKFSGVHLKVTERRCRRAGELCGKGDMVKKGGVEEGA